MARERKVLLCGEGAGGGRLCGKVKKRRLCRESRRGKWSTSEEDDDGSLGKEVGGDEARRVALRPQPSVQPPRRSWFSRNQDDASLVAVVVGTLLFEDLSVEGWLP